ncbi:MAG: outer membrane beta-barrel protein [Alistipes sp.]|nr:outer membrane beta-barrel protein [Alistipes sp.]
MRKFLLFVLTLCATVSTAFAQQKGKVNLVLVDSVTKQAVIGAVVELYPTAKPDSKRYYTSNVDGSVPLPSLAYGEYTIVATCLGYDDLNKTFTVKGATLNLGKVDMKESTTRIDTVVKEVKSLRASQNGDTLSYNAGAFKVSTDADVEGLLKKMPGININNGEVEAQGETIKKVFVDGKEFFGEDVNTAIKSLPAEAVDRIEVFNKLSDQAEFSGMDDGEGYKALNIVTKTNMRQGQFGKMYAGYGYQPQTDDITSHHKYTVGGNVNFFQGDSRVSVLALFNNINQQNFSFEDILGVSGGSGGGRRGFGQYMVRPQSGVAAVNSIGLNYSDQWGRKDQVKFQGSYFFNNTNTKNLSVTDTWYEDPSPVDTLHTEGRSHTINNNHRFNARLDWKISRNHSLMSRTSFSFQGNDPLSESAGYQYGQSGLLYQYNWSDRNGRGYNFREFLQYRVKLGKPGRTLTVDGNFNYRNNNNTRKLISNESSGVDYGSSEYNDLYAEFVQGGQWSNMNSNSALYSPIYQIITAPTREYNVRGNLSYNEPLSHNSSLSLQYRLSYEDELKDQEAFYYGSDAFDPTSQVPNNQMTSKYESGYWTHRVGPGYRYSKDRNTIVANVYYQYSELDGNIVKENGEQGDKIARKFHNIRYFGMVNYAFNKENTLRIRLFSNTSSPSVTQLQSIFDVSTPQYLSIGNKDLNPSFSHRVNIHYVHSNIEKGRTFMWMASAETQQDYISSATLYCPAGFELSRFGDEVTVPTNSKGENYRPQRITSYENMDGYWSLRTHVSYGLPLSFMKCNLNMSAGVNYSIIPSAVYNTTGDVVENILNHNFTTNYAKNIGYDAALTLGSNISENIDFTISWRGRYNQAWNTAAKGGAKNDYFNHSASASLKWVFWKGFTFTAAASYNQYIGITQDYNEQYILCNLYLGKKLFKNKRGEIQIGVNDVANQNTAFSRATGSGYTQNMTNSVIGRYYSIQFVYNLRHFGKRGSKQMADYDYKESKSSVGMGNSNGGVRMGPPMMRR